MHTRKKAKRPQNEQKSVSKVDFESGEAKNEKKDR